MSPRSQPNLTALFSFSQIEPRVQTHLKKVYGCLAVGVLAAAAAAYVQIAFFSSGLGLIGSLGAIGMMLLLAGTNHSKKNESLRFAYYIGFCVLSGMGLNYLLRHAIAIDPSLIATALLGTSVVFVSFSLSALMTRQRSMLFLGGFLMTALFYMTIASLVNIFMRSQALMQVQLYIGLAVMCAFVLYDTQLIVEKNRMGDDDYIWHTIQLFVDMINIFRYLLIILSEKEKNKKRRD